MENRILSPFYIRRKVTRDGIQCRCGAWNSKFNERCYKCGEYLSA